MQAELSSRAEGERGEGMEKGFGGGIWGEFER